MNLLSRNEPISLFTDSQQTDYKADVKPINDTLKNV